MGVRRGVVGLLVGVRRSGGGGRESLGRFASGRGGWFFGLVVWVVKYVLCGLRCRWPARVLVVVRVI